MEKIINYSKALRDLNISYLGKTQQSTKLQYSYNNGYETYGIYLAPATKARDAQHPNINVCPFSKMCAESCLEGSGQNKCATLHLNNPKNELSHIDKARIKKTHLFYDNRDLFMRLVISEINRFQNHAKKRNMGFAVRLNCTSDLSPELFKFEDKNILELFPNVQFYDYTKVPNRLFLPNKYHNYYVVFSYDGTNWGICEWYLQRGGNVAVVFDLYDDKGKQILPNTFKGYEVIDGNKSDIRFTEGGGKIVGLHYHRVANDYLSGKYKPKDTPFVIRY